MAEVLQRHVFARQLCASSSANWSWLGCGGSFRSLEQHPFEPLDLGAVIELAHGHRPVPFGVVDQEAGALLLSALVRRADFVRLAA